MAQATNCLIMGSGRCGTSALAAALAHAGAFTGFHIYGPTPQQPGGYFEDKWVSEWNDAAIRQSDPDYKGLFITPAKKELPNLAFPKEVSRVWSYCWMRPYALKDPRFAFTYPIWKPFLVQPSVVFVLFRNPSDFVASALRLRADHPLISDDPQALLGMWKNSYEHVLANDDGTFFYFEFPKFISDRYARIHINNTLKYVPDWEQIKIGQTHRTDDPCPEELVPLYSELKHRASSE